MATNTILVCAPCESRGISLTAIKYCKTCREPLCKVCVECHKSFKATKNHLLVQSVGQNSWKITCDLENFQMCSQHPNKQTEFYCGDHDTLLCSLCLLKSESHENCAKVIEIDTAGKSFLTTHFMKIVSDTCLKTANTAASAVTEVKKAKDCTSNSLKGLKNETENIRSKMLQAFDRQSNNIIQSVSADLLANTCKCEKALQNLGNLENGMRENEILLKNVIENGSPADVFRCVKSIIGQCEDFQSEIEQTKRQCLRQNITCERSNIVRTIEQNPFLFYNVENVALEIADISTDQFKQRFRSGIAVIPTEIVAKGKDKPRLGDRTVESKASHEILPGGQRMAYRTIESKAGHGILPDGPRMGDRTIESKASHGILPDGPRMGYRTTERKASQGILPSMLSYDSETSSNYSDLDASNSEPYSSAEHTPNLDLKVSYCRNFEVELSDGKTPWFGGIVCLPDERLISSDYNNSRIIIVRNNGTVTEKNIDFIPGNITLFNGYLVVCHMNTNKLSLMKLEKNGLKEYKYLQTRYHPKCVQAVDNDKILVSSRNGKGEWSLDILIMKGQKWHSVRINIELTGKYDGYKLEVQHVPDSHDGFRIIQCCEDSAILQCFHEAGGSAIFHYGVQNTSSVLTDHLGYIFIIKFRGEVQVLSPGGTHVSKIFRKAMHTIKLSSFNKSADKLFITTHKDSRIHILDVKRQ